MIALGDFLVRILYSNRVPYTPIQSIPLLPELLKWLTGSSPANPRMAWCELKVQNSWSCSVHKAGSLCWSSVYMYAGTWNSLSFQCRNVLANKARARGKWAKASFFREITKSSSRRLGQNKGVSSGSKIQIKGVPSHPYKVIEGLFPSLCPEQTNQSDLSLRLSSLACFTPSLCILN